MKMTKRGVDPKDKLVRSICRNCGSEYEHTITDPDIKRSCEPFGDRYNWFPCQLCAYQVIVASEQTNK